MKIDLASAGMESFRDSGLRRTQVCIVGGGIAGLVLADCLAAGGLDVVLLEAGGRKPPLPGEDQKADVELSGEAHLGSRQGRPRVLGGSSLVWGGQLLPMLPGASWPVATGEFEPFYQVIHKLLAADDLPYEAQAFLEAAGSSALPMPEAAPGMVARLSKFAPFGARNLGLSLGERLRQSARVRVVLQARVTALHMAPCGERVGSVEVQTPAGGVLSVEADDVVIAAGTVESCRLLLASARSQAAGAEKGIGDQNAQLGRNFHDHLTVEVARFEAGARERAVALFRPWVVGGLRGTLHGWKLEADDELRRRLGLNPALAHVTFEEPETSGVAAVRAMLLARQRGERPAGIDWATLPGALRDTWRLRREVRVNGRRYISPEVRVALRVNVAQVLGHSWVGLSARRDEDGEPLARVHWEHAPADLRSVRLFAAHLQRQFRRMGFDDLQWDPDALPLPRAMRPAGSAPCRSLDRPLPGLEDARHAMGGACMGTDPRTSVVDANLRVHGVHNLYVASAAVFPDGRAQLPTLTLMALTLRLAGHLRAELEERR